MKRAVRVVSIALVAVFLMGPSYAGAQTNSGIAGVVKDTSGAVLPGVTVEASSPALIEKTRTAVTDASGEYKIVNLQPGTYIVTFSLAGFNTVKREGIELGPSFTANISADMRVGGIEETLIVTGEAPLVDVHNSQLQSVIRRDVVEAIPTGQTYAALGTLIPGMTVGGNTSSPVAQDVGGTVGNSYIRLSIHGARQTDQMVNVSGMNVMDYVRYDTAAIAFQDANYQDYVFQYSGQSTEVETGGVRVDLIPKDGANAFKGTFIANFENGALQGSNLSAELIARQLTVANSVKKIYTVNSGLGGPIRKDRFWFYGSLNLTETDNYVGGMFINTTPRSWTPTFDLTQQAVNAQTVHDGSIRLNWVIGKSKFNVFANHNLIHLPNFTVSANQTPEASSDSQHLNNLYQATWQLPITSRLLLDAGFSHAGLLVTRYAVLGPESLPRITNSSGLSYRQTGQGFVLNDPTWNRVVNANLSYVTGSHAFKAGFTDQYLLVTNDTRNYPGQDLTFGAINFRPSSVTYNANPNRSVNFASPNLGIYIQDQWTLKRTTLSGGLRFDYIKMGFPDELLPAGQWVPVARAITGANILSWKDLSPRVGVVYDLFGDGKTAIKGNLSRFVLQQGPGITQAFNPANTNNTNTRTWTDNGDFIIQGDPFNPLTNLELGPSGNLNFGKPIITTQLDTDWANGFNTRPANWETSVSVQRQMLPRLSVVGAYYRRWYVNFVSTDNRAFTPASYTSYCVTAPSDSRLPGSGGYQVCDLFDVNSGFGSSNNLLTRSSNYGNQFEHWNGFDFTADARLQRGVTLQGGISVGKTTADNCDVVTKFPEVQSANSLSAAGLSTQWCHQETPWQPNLKALTSFRLKWDFQVAATFQSTPGPLISATYTATNAVILPSLKRNLAQGPGGSVSINLVQPGTLFGERLYQTDVRLSRTFRFGRLRAQALVDAYNLFNANTVLVQNNAFGTNGASWQVPQQILQARLVKLGAVINF